MDRVLDQVDFEKKFARLPAFRPDDPQRGTISLPSTPSAIMRTMWEKQRVTDAGLDAVSSPMLTPRTPKMANNALTPRTPSNRRESSSSTSSSFFFGPNFNLATANEQVYPVRLVDQLQ
jgi:hypothetical protein